MIILFLASEIDRKFAAQIEEELKEWDAPYKTEIASAHKAPERVIELVDKYNREEKIVYITVVGRSNGLSGVISGSSSHPVIACPNFKDKNDMIVNIHSTLQMPSDVPVMTVLDPKNAAIAACRILGLCDKKMKGKIDARIKEIKNRYQRPSQ